jgi:hypothetical protein
MGLVLESAFCVGMGSVRSAAKTLRDLLMRITAEG